MPQKKNPDLLELVRGKAARLIGSSTTLRSLMKGLPLAYNKDMQETQEVLFDASDTITTMLPLAAAFMQRVKFNHVKMNLAASAGYMNAWAAAAFLVERGVPSRHAHEAVGKAVQSALERGCELEQLPLTDLQTIHPKFTAEIYPKLGLLAVLEVHDVPGGTSPQFVRRALQAARQNVESLRAATLSGEP